MTLTETVRRTKLGLRVGGITVGALLAIRIVFLIYDLTIRLPEPAIPPALIDCKYSPVPPLVLERVPINFPTNFSIILDLVRGDLPPEPAVANIYPVLKAPYGFLSQDRAKNLAETFDFTDEPIKISSTESLWRRVNETLRVNTQSLNYSFAYNYSADPSVFVAGRFTSQSQIQALAKVIFEQHSFFADKDPLNDLRTEDRDVEFPIHMLRYQDQKLQPTRQILAAAAARVDFPRRNVTYTLSNGVAQDYSFVPPHYIDTNVNILMAGINAENAQLLEFNFTHWRYAPEQAATCPVISSTTAWELVQQDPALFTIYLGNLDLGPLDRLSSVPVVQKIDVKNVFLAFYDPTKEQDFIQPVWVFVGKGQIVQGGELDWIGYVPALHPDYLQGSE